MRAIAPAFLATLVACAPANSENTEVQSCVDELVELFEERAAFFEEHAGPLAMPAGDTSDAMPLEDMQPFVGLVEGLEMRENRIQIALRDCPAAASLKSEADRALPVQMVSP